MTNTFFWIVLALQPSEPDYPTLLINHFMAFCGVGVRNELLMQGFPNGIAVETATKQCACVMDKIRLSMSAERFVDLSQADQQKLSLDFAYECAGVQKPEETVEPI
jgi:hypothetical protein